VPRDDSQTSSTTTTSEITHLVETKKLNTTTILHNTLLTSPAPSPHLTITPSRQLSSFVHLHDGHAPTRTKHPRPPAPSPLPSSRCGPDYRTLLIAPTFPPRRRRLRAFLSPLPPPPACEAAESTHVRDLLASSRKDAERSCRTLRRGGRRIRCSGQKPAK
jgi:hypothetical protein